MNQRTRLVLEVLIGPLAPTILLLAPMLAGLVTFTAVAFAGRGAAGLAGLLALLGGGVLGLAALWAAVLRGDRLLFDPVWIRVSIGIGLLLGLCAAVAVGPTLLIDCPTIGSCAMLAYALVGPSLIGVLKMRRLVASLREAEPG